MEDREGVEMGGAPQGGCTLVAGEGAEEAEMSTSTHYQPVLWGCLPSPDPQPCLLLSIILQG